MAEPSASYAGGKDPVSRYECTKERERKLQYGLTIWPLLPLQFNGFNQVVYHALLLQRHGGGCSTVMSVGGSVDLGKLEVSEVSNESREGTPVVLL